MKKSPKYDINKYKFFDSKRKLKASSGSGSSSSTSTVPSGKPAAPTMVEFARSDES